MKLEIGMKLICVDLSYGKFHYEQVCVSEFIHSPYSRGVIRFFEIEGSPHVPSIYDAKTLKAAYSLSARLIEATEHNIKLMKTRQLLALISS